LGGGKVRCENIGGHQEDWPTRWFKKEVSMIVIEDEPGRGRKQCPNCEKYISARMHKCPKCEHRFLRTKKTTKKGERTMAKTKKKVTPKGTAGKGRKQCPQCEKYVGARASKCDCGHEFPKNTKNTKKSGLSDTLKKLSDVKDFVAEAGGYDEATAQIERLQKLSKALGGNAELNEAIKTLKEWDT